MCCFPRRAHAVLAVAIVLYPLGDMLAQTPAVWEQTERAPRVLVSALNVSALEGTLVREINPSGPGTGFTATGQSRAVPSGAVFLSAPVPEAAYPVPSVLLPPLTTRTLIEKLFIFTKQLIQDEIPGWKEHVQGWERVLCREAATGFNTWFSEWLSYDEAHPANAGSVPLLLMIVIDYEKLIRGETHARIFSDLSLESVGRYQLPVYLAVSQAPGGAVVVRLEGVAGGERLFSISRENKVSLVQ